MAEAAVERIPEPEGRRVTLLTGVITPGDVALASEYDAGLLDPNALDNPALGHEDKPPRVFDDSVWDS